MHLGFCRMRRMADVERIYLYRVDACFGRQPREADHLLRRARLEPHRSNGDGTVQLLDRDIEHVSQLGRTQRIRLAAAAARGIDADTGLAESLEMCAQSILVEVAFVVEGSEADDESASCSCARCRHRVVFIA